ncbi:MAG: 16S rRNA (uracil(1498)-N(3))-methyltransferase [Cyanobacteria bacterium J06626_18]
MQRIVVGTEQIEGSTLSLTPDQQHYLMRVLRLRGGDCFLALDGKGGLWFATLTPSGEQAHLTVSEDVSTNSSSSSAAASANVIPPITLAACLPKQGFDEVIRQVTELGVDQVVPLISDRTLLRPSPNKLQRWRRIAAEAAEQSERLTVPKVYDPIVLPQWLTQRTEKGRYFCVARYIAPSLLSVCLGAGHKATVIAVGPEGGWTESEIETAISADYQLVTLGMGVLRAVTASVAAVSILRSGFEFASIGPHTPRQL